jgi:DNA adenine methylase
VLLANDPEGISEVVNDTNADLTNFWQVLQSQTAFNQLQRLLESVPFSEIEFDNASENSILEADGYGETVHRAATFFIRCRQSMSGRMKSFAPLVKNRTRRGMQDQVSAWLSAVEGLPAIHARLIRVAILNRPAVEVIKQQDGPRTLVYADPPYLHTTRSTTKEYGEHEMSMEQHEELLTTLSQIKGRFVLSGYPSALYESFRKKHGWNTDAKQIDNKSSKAAEKELKDETLWWNF